MALTPHTVQTYHVFLASPGDVGIERQKVRDFFEQYNRDTAQQWGVQFQVIDWENYSTTGVGRPQELITQQTLEKYKDSLALVIGIMAQRFGSPSGEAESGTQEEFEWAMKSNKDNAGWPEIKWFFRSKKHFKIVATEPDEIQEAAAQWTKVLRFREEMQNLNNPLFFTEYDGAEGFSEVLAKDLRLWLNDSSRPWAANRTNQTILTGSADIPQLAMQFNDEPYRKALLKRFDKLNFEMLDTRGAFYNEVRLWSVFVPQSARECHEYNPKLLEITKEHQLLLESGEMSEEELEDVLRQAKQLRQDFFSKPISPILELINSALSPHTSTDNKKLVILGDPGSGKSSLIRYLALRWAGIDEASVRNQQPIPLVIDLGSYGAWQCEGKKGFIRFLEEEPVWYEWQKGELQQLIQQSGRVVLLLDGLDEIFDTKLRRRAMDDIQRFSDQNPRTPIIVTSRVVGYKTQQLKNAGFRHYMLQDLNNQQITTFINNWHKETYEDAEQAIPKRDRLLKAIKDSKSIAMLASNPLLLTMMAILNRNQELPRDRIDLYEQASRVLLHQWDTERALEDFPGVSSEVGFREKSEILRLVASHMQNGPGGLKGNMIDGDSLIKLIEDYLYNELRFEQSRAAARALVEQLRERNFILCFVGADSYAFIHRTLLEYFCATNIVQQFHVKRKLSEETLITLFHNRSADDDWREVLRLICGQIDDVFVVKIVEELLRRSDMKDLRLKPPPELPLALWCLSEIRNLAPYQQLVKQEVDILVSDGLREIYRQNTNFREELIQATSEISWPCREYFKQTILLAIPKLQKYDLATFWYAKLFAIICEEPKEMLPLLNYTNANLSADIRVSAIQAMVDKWQCIKSRQLIEKQMLGDNGIGPLRSAFHTLVRHWPDQRTRQLLEHRATQDDFEYARYMALTCLADHWPDKNTLALLGSNISSFNDSYYKKKLSKTLQNLRQKITY